MYQRKLLPLLLVLLYVGIAGCSDDDDPVNIGLVGLQSNPTLGNYLVDGNGKTLYFFTKDVAGESQCTGGCLTDWPIYYAPDLQPTSGIGAGDFSTITRSDGSQQTTYKGWPLYYYSGDANPGDVSGEAVGGVWYIAKPNYSIMLANAQLVGNDRKSYTSNYEEGTGETQYFVDALGRTLYTFINDSFNQNNFTNEDLSNNGVWPIFHVDVDALPSTLKASDFGEIDVHGNQQLTYKGNPLYYFGGDGSRGENKGVSVPVPGIWPVAGPQTTAPASDASIMLRDDPTFGAVLTDAENRTLYFFSRDTKGESNCAGGCLTRWPIFNVDEIILPPGGGLSEDDFGTIGDGETKQITYKGWPLYYYSPNNDGVIEAAGENAGDNFGNIWFVAKPDYSLMVASAQLVGLDGKNYLDDYTEGDGNTRYFTDAEGRTLYIFINDSDENNTYTQPDFSNDSVWPVFHTEIENLPTGMSASDFGEITVHGRSQLTYKGWPVYYFGQDGSRGDNKGVSVPTPGVWPVLTAETEAAPL